MVLGIGSTELLVHLFRSATDVVLKYHVMCCHQISSGAISPLLQVLTTSLHITRR